MIIKRKLYSLHNTPAAKKVAKKLTGVLIPVKTATENTKHFLLRLGNGGGNELLNTRHQLELAKIKGSSLRKGVKVGKAVELPGKTVLDGAEAFGKTLDAQALAGANTALALTVGAHNPAAGIAIQNFPSTAAGLAAGGLLRRNSPKYDAFMTKVGKATRKAVSNVTGLTDETTLKTIQENSRGRKFRRRFNKYRKSVLSGGSSTPPQQPNSIQFRPAYV